MNLTSPLAGFICNRCVTSLRQSSRSFLEHAKPRKIPDYSRQKRYHTTGSRARDTAQYGAPLKRSRPFRVAVIGSGPAGFYTAYKVMSKMDDCHVDMYDSLPVPFGLVRFGVAPDHPEVKNCQDKFTEVASSSRFRFIGNIAVGHELPLSSLKPHYDALVLAYGASQDRQLGIPGESSLKGIYSARAFVGWYNGLPEYAALAPSLEAGEEAVVIGQGNVALDVARILLTDVDVLRKTDITDYALETLSRSRVKRVRVVGRRGPMQAAFTIREVRELMDLPSVGFHPIDRSYLPQDPTKLFRTQKRLAQLLSRDPKTPTADAKKSWELCFGLSPIGFEASSQDPAWLSGITFEKQTLSGDDSFDFKAKAIATGETTSLPASLAFRSIGYKSEPLPGFSGLGIPFDEAKGIIPNDMDGRVLADLQGRHGAHIPGIYTAGWAKRGPTGVIASTMNDAFATAEAINKDREDNAVFWNGEVGPGKGSTGLGWEGIAEDARRRELRRVSWEDWLKIDQAEKERGSGLGKEREKVSTVSQMLDIVDSVSQ